MAAPRSIIFMGDSLINIKAFPEAARRRAGYELRRVQNGLEPNDWKAMLTIGHRVREIRIRDVSGAYRVIYSIEMAGVIYVLHAFLKKSQKTLKRHIDLARSRLRQVKGDIDED